MKNKIPLIIIKLSLLLIISTFVFSSCGNTQLNVNAEGDITPTSSGFIDICDEPIALVYDSMTRIVYIEVYHQYDYTYTAYYAPNGLPYRYNPETNALEEINNEEK